MRRPLFIARQAKNPNGLLGNLVASIMVHETKSANLRAIEALSVEPDDYVLDIGCGNGLSLEILSQMAPCGQVAGVDTSSLMVQRALARNRKRVNDGRVEVSLASVDRLPFEDKTFNKVMSVHTVYFWEDLDQAFGEIARVTKDGGRLALVLRTSEDGASTDAFPSEVYSFRPIAVIEEALRCAGYGVSHADSKGVDGPATLLFAEKRTS